MTSNTTLLMINTFGMLFVITNSFALGLRFQVGQILAHFFQQWRLAVWVLLINFAILPALIIGFAAIVPIPADIKIGYCIVALAAGAPFAPAITRLAKGNVAMSTAMFLVMVVVTVIVAALLLPLAVSAVVPSVKHVANWDVAWPLLVFVITPLFIGCLMRFRYEEVVSSWVRPLLIVSITCLLLYGNLFVVSSWSQFVSAWNSGAYIAAIAVPILGIAFGSVISIKDAGTRHACAITTAQRSITAAIILTIFNYPQPLANVSVTIINGVGILILLILGIEWGRAQAHKSSLASTTIAPAAHEDTGHSQ
jgi:bile acid:Na+ symporter, BASS family